MMSAGHRSRMPALYLLGRMVCLKISEVVLQISENGDLHIPSELLQEMGLSPADPVCLAYLTRDGVKNDYQEFLLSPESIEAGEDEEKLLIPSPLLEQANLSPGEDIQILCLDRAIVLCETSTLDRNDLEAILQQLRAAQELAFSLPEEAGSLIHQLEQIIQEGAIGHEAAE